MLTQIDVADVAGINGVPWDAVESQAIYGKLVLGRRSGVEVHFRSLSNRRASTKRETSQLLKAKTSKRRCLFYGQLEFALFDFRLAYTFDPSKQNQVLDMLHEVKRQVAVIPGAEWEECRTASVIFLPVAMRQAITAIYGQKSYRQMPTRVLKRKGFSTHKPVNPSWMKFHSKAALELMTLFKNCGREPQLDALLRHKGIAS